MRGENEDVQRWSNAELRSRLDFGDTQLLAECQVHRYRASGPGGQHRNKVSSAIRLHHKPSGLVTLATESRLQRENKTRALKRLREAIALVARVPLPPKVVWPESINVVEGRLRVSEKNPAIHHVMALVLDAFAESSGRLAAAARRLGLTSSSLARFLKAHPKAWREVARMRSEAGLPPLRA
ncbi:MAG: peptide chain release factor family protein [Phycisphaerae bacterium]